MTSEVIREDIVIAHLPPNTDVRVASVATGRSLLASDDQFILNQSPFDRHARLNLTQEALEVTPEIYKDFLKSQVLAWKPNEVELLKRIYSHIAPKFDRLGFVLPQSIYLVKTTGFEEGFAAHTRQLNTIVLPSRRFAALQELEAPGPFESNQTIAHLEETIIHESFHLFTKNNPLLRERLYGLVGYHVMREPVSLSNIPWPDSTSSATLADMKITNPDAPVLDTYIELEVPEYDDQKTPSRVKMPLVPILVSSRPYDGGVFFDYLNWYLMPVQLVTSGHWELALSHNGQLRLFAMDGTNTELYEQYLSLVGRNAEDEIFHPEEVLAQNFVYAAQLPNLDLISSLGNTIKPKYV